MDDRLDRLDRAADPEIDDEDRARLHSELDAADDELRAGKGIPADQFLAELRRGIA